jgi:AcrR family transcriptional regulator
VTNRDPRRIGRPPAADGAATRVAIIEAASAQMFEQGYAAMTVDSVADSVGITRAAIYRYFASKRELVRAVIQAAIPDFERHYAELAVGAETLADRLRALMRAVVQVSIDEPNLMVGYFQLAKLARDDDQLSGLFRVRSQVMRGVIADLVEDAIDQGELSSEIEVNAIVEPLSGLIWALALGAAEAPTERIRMQIHDAVELLFREPPWM